MIYCYAVSYFQRFIHMNRYLPLSARLTKRQLIYNNDFAGGIGFFLYFNIFQKWFLQYQLFSIFEDIEPLCRLLFIRNYNTSPYCSQNISLKHKHSEGEFSDFLLHHYAIAPADIQYHSWYYQSLFY